jgi:hypothetical protein
MPDQATSRSIDEAAIWRLREAAADYAEVAELLDCLVRCFYGIPGGDYTFRGEAKEANYLMGAIVAAAFANYDRLDEFDVALDLQE